MAIASTSSATSAELRSANRRRVLHAVYEQMGISKQDLSHESAHRNPEPERI